MREYAFEIAQALTNGIVPHEHIPAGAPFAKHMENLVPRARAGCAVNPEEITEGVSVTASWPRTRLYYGDQTMLLLESTGISTVNPTNNAKTALTIYNSADNSTSASLANGGGYWQVASAEDVWFACDGVNLVGNLPRNINGQKNTQLMTPITCKTIGMHYDRLILGGLGGNWFSGSRFTSLFNVFRGRKQHFTHDLQTWSDRWIVYGEPIGGDTSAPYQLLLTALGCYGDTAFDKVEGVLRSLVESGAIGFASMRRGGTPQVILPQGQRILVFGDRGLYEFNPEQGGPGYVGRLERETQVAGRGAACGVERETVWLSKTGDLFRWTLGQGIGDPLGWRHLLGSMTNPVISHDPEVGDYWISDATNAYVLTSDGKLGGPMDVRPTGVFRYNGILRGTGLGLDSQDELNVEFQLHQTDMNYRGSKATTVVEVNYEGLTDVEVDMYARDGVGDTYTLFPATETVNSDGVAFPKRSANDFRPTIRGTGDAGTGYALQGVVVRYNGENRTYRRGATAPAEGS
jgi:hypothetical protein